MRYLRSEEEFVKYAGKQAKKFEDGVRNGTIKAGKYIKKLVERSDTTKLDDRFEVRLDEARRFFRFCSKMPTDNDSEYVQIDLQPFQSYLWANIFGVYYKGTNRRRYNEVALIMGRKNAKTTVAAFTSNYMLLGDRQINPQVAIISTVEGRAQVLEDMQKIIRQCPEINPYLLMSNYKIYINNNQRVDGERELRTLNDIGWCKILPNDFKKLDALKLCSAILDEIHTYPDWNSYLTLKKGTGARNNSLLMLISTAGYLPDAFCYQYISYCKRVLDGEIEDDSLFPMLWILDEEDYTDGKLDLSDRNLWYKTNPGLGPILKIEKMEEWYNQARHNPQARIDFLVKDLNIFQNSAEESALAIEDIEKTCRPVEEEKIMKLQCWVGIDLSFKRDMAAIICLFKDETEDTFYVKPYFFITDTMKSRYPRMQEWINDGFIKECTGGIYDFKLIADTLTEIVNTYDVQLVGYDSYKWNDINEKIDWLSISLPKDRFFPVYQGTKTMGKPLIFMLNKFYSGDLILGTNPVMKWTMSNARIMVGDTNGNPKIFKDKAKMPDDGATALNDAFVSYEKDKENKKAPLPIW